MRSFEINNQIVTIKCGTSIYIDTWENYRKDGGVWELREDIYWDEEVTIVDGKCYTLSIPLREVTSQLNALLRSQKNRVKVNGNHSTPR